MATPLHFITVSNGKFNVGKEARTALETLDKPVPVVCIIGPYRTGKSAIMSLLYNKKLTGFELGGNITSCTKGIWMMIRDDMVVLDTEGLYDAEHGSADHDAKIFTLSILLSSFLIYNTKNTITESDIRQLSFVTHLTEHIQMKANQEEEGDEFAGLFPYFCWLVRDKFLETKLENKTLTDDEYLEWALKLKKSRKHSTQEANNIRESICDFFKNRMCFQLPRPMHKEEDLRNLDKIDFESLRPEFVKGTKKFLSLVEERAPVKKLNNIPLTGPMFLAFVDKILEYINNGSIPVIEDSFKCMQKAQNQKAIKQAVSLYNLTMETKCGKKYPVESKDLLAFHEHASSLAVKLYNKNAVQASGDDKIYQKELANAIASYTKQGIPCGGAYFQFYQKNNRASAQKCSSILNKLYLQIANKISKNAYFKPKGTFEDYLKDKSAVESTYDKTKNKGPMAVSVKTTFFKLKCAEAKQLLVANKQMSKLDKEAAQANEERKQAQREKKEALSQKETLKNELIAREKQHKEQVVQFQKDQQAKLAEMQKKNTDLLNHRLSEQKKLLEAGFTERANLLQETIGEMKDANKVLQDQHMAELKQMNCTVSALESTIQQLKDRPPEVHHHHEESSGFCSLM